MAVAPLNRTRLDNASALLDAFLKHQQALSGQTGQSAVEISQERQEKVLVLSATYEARTQAVAFREAGRARIAVMPKEISDMEFELVYALNRRNALVREHAALQRQRFEAKEAYDEAKRTMAQVNSEIENAMGAALDHAPKSSDPSPKLDSSIQAWAQKFGALSKTETVEFFKATAEKAGAQLDLRKIDADIVNCEIERDGVERQVPQLEGGIAGLKAALVTAQDQQGARENAVLVPQGEIDAIKRELAELAHRSGLHEILSVEADAVGIALIEAHDEARENLISLKSALSALEASSLSNKDRKVFKPFQDKRGELVAILKGVDKTKSMFDNVPEFETIYEDGKDLAGLIDGYLVSPAFFDAAQRSRERMLQDPVRDEILKEVLDDNNALAESEAHKVTSISIDHSILVAASKIGDKANLVVTAAQKDHVREAAQADYDAKAKVIVDRLLAEAANQAEIQRHSDLDAAAADALYADLNATERRAVLKEYKKMAPDDGTVVGLRTALQEALRLQACPDPALWRRILGLKAGKDFPKADPLNASNSVKYESHTSFYPDCLGPGANKNIYLANKSGVKAKADAVIKKLFETGINRGQRAHTTLEVFGADDVDNPHAYFYSDGNHYMANLRLAFDYAVGGDDESWMDEVANHLCDQMDNKMTDLQAKVQMWLDTNGKR